MATLKMNVSTANSREREKNRNALTGWWTPEFFSSKERSKEGEFMVNAEAGSPQEIEMQTEDIHEQPELKRAYKK